MVSINDSAPDFSEEAFYEGVIKKVSLSDYRGKWVILFFYPADFTLVCPTELESLADNYDAFKRLGAEIISVSTDTAHVHKAWYESSSAIGKIRFPMLADPAHRVSRDYSVLVPQKGMSIRATFLIDPKGMVKAIEYHDNDIGRSVDELLRKLQAAKFVQEHKGKLCPMNWKPGSHTINTGGDVDEDTMQGMPRGDRGKE